jgi:cytoskeleton protein RodZ
VPREGRQELKIIKKGYQEWNALVDENMPFPSPITLNPAGFTLRVITKPPGAKVFINGQSAGLTPIESLDIPGRGPKNLILELEGFKTWRGKVGPGKPLPNPIVLKPDL